MIDYIDYDYSFYSSKKNDVNMSLLLKNALKVSNFQDNPIHKETLEFDANIESNLYNFFSVIQYFVKNYYLTNYESTIKRIKPNSIQYYFVDMIWGKNIISDLFLDNISQNIFIPIKWIPTNVLNIIETSLTFSNNNLPYDLNDLLQSDVLINTLLSIQNLNYDFSKGNNNSSNTKTRRTKKMNQNLIGSFFYSDNEEDENDEKKVEDINNNIDEDNDNIIILEDNIDDMLLLNDDDNDNNDDNINNNININNTKNDISSDEEIEILISQNQNQDITKNKIKNRQSLINDITNYQLKVENNDNFDWNEGSDDDSN
jgi:hypothetical protein